MRDLMAEGRKKRWVENALTVLRDRRRQQMSCDQCGMACLRI